MRPKHIEDILIALHTGQWFVWSDSKNKVYENLVIYGDQEKPTEEFLESELLRLQTEFDAQEYARNRKAEYPHLSDLVVALWEGVVEERMESVVDLEGKRQAVKQKYLKP